MFPPDPVEDFPQGPYQERIPMKTESAGRVLGMYVDMSRHGIASCRVCLVIARTDGSLTMTR